VEPDEVGPNSSEFASTVNSAAAESSEQAAGGRPTSLAKGTLYNVFARLAFIASGYALQFSMARWFASPVDFGRFSVLLSLVTLARMVFSSGIPQAVSKFVAAESGPSHAIYRRAVGLQLAASSIAWLALVALAPALTSFLGDPSLRGPLLLASPLVVLMAVYQVNLGYIGGRLWFGRQAFLTLVTSISRYLLPAAFVLAGWGIEGAVIGLVISSAVVAFMSWTSTPRGTAASSVSAWQFLQFSWPLVIFAFGVNALMNFDLLLLKRYFPQSDYVGFYGGAANLGKAPYFAFYAFSATALPALSRFHAAGDMGKVREELRSQVRYLMLVLLPAGGLLAASATETLALVYGKSYAAADGPLGLLSVSTCALSLMVVLASALTACGQPRMSMLPVLLCLPSQWLLGTLLIPEGGMLGAATSNLLATLLGLAVALVLAWRTIGNVVDLGVLGRIGASTLAAAVAFHALPGTGGLWLFGKLGISSIAYGLALVLTGAVSRADIAALCRSVRGSYRRRSGQLPERVAPGEP
jgi:stage V sporulation protein B